MSLTSHQYGKQAVRVLKVSRRGEEYHLKEITGGLMLELADDGAYQSEDNSQVVPTDTIKNTITVLAKEHLQEDREPYAVHLAQHFLTKYPQVTVVTVELEERIWKRIKVEGKPHPHSFLHPNTGTPYTRVRYSRQGEKELVSGIRDFRVLKATASGFVGYPKCDLTTLPETEDRIFSTLLEAEWRYSEIPTSYYATNELIVETMLKVFATEYSPSVQRTLLQMGEAALQAVPEIDRIAIKLPNKHYLPVNLMPFGLKNDGEIFLPTDEPHGQIEAMITR
jgi:urate oxidase